MFPRFSSPLLQERRVAKVTVTYQTGAVVDYTLEADPHFVVEFRSRSLGSSSWIPSGDCPSDYATEEDAREAVKKSNSSVKYRVVRIDPDGSRVALPNPEPKKVYRVVCFPIGYGKKFVHTTVFSTIEQAAESAKLCLKESGNSVEIREETE